MQLNVHTYFLIVCIYLYTICHMAYYAMRHAYIRMLVDSMNIRINCIWRIVIAIRAWLCHIIYVDIIIPLLRETPIKHDSRRRLWNVMTYGSVGVIRWPTSESQPIHHEYRRQLAMPNHLYYYRRRMQMSLHTSVFNIWRKYPRSFVIPLQSSREFVYA